MKIAEYCQKNNIKCKTDTQDGRFIVALVTPLMERVHKHVPQSAEMVFMDASGNMDRYDCSMVNVDIQTEW